MLLTLTDKGRRVHSDIDKISIELYSSWLKHIPMRDRAGIIDAIELLDDAMEKRRRAMRNAW